MGDGASELAKACQTVGAAHDSAIPGDTRGNAVAERTNGIVQDGCRALLMTAGLPIQFWIYACQYFSHCYNLQPSKDGGPSPWIRRWGEPFDKVLVPFGSKIRYTPQKRSPIKEVKPDARMKVGLFLGFVHDAGGQVGNRIYAVRLSELEGLDYRTGKKKDGAH